MTLKGDAKFKGKLTCGLKNDKRNFVNFHASSRKSQNLHFDWMLLSKAYKYRRVMFHDNEEWSKVWRKTDSCFQNDMKTLVNFHPNTQKSKNFTLMGYFCSKDMRFQLKKYKELIFHDTEQWRKIWINPDFVVSKMTWGIRWTFIRALKAKKLYIDRLFLSKAYNVSARKFERNYVPWHWRVIQNLKENWDVAWKMT